MVTPKFIAIFLQSENTDVRSAVNADSDEANFVRSLTQIIQEWGFDGLDIDLESGSNLLHGTQIQARLPRALKQIEANTGGNMYLTMAPEHPYVQGGMIAYSGIWGAYIPMIDQLRDMLDLLHVQLYNNGGQAPIQNIISALDCLTLGTSCGSVVPSKLYPNFGGVMTWSINWDQHDGFNFSGPVGDKLKAMNGK